MNLRIKFEINEFEDSPAEAWKLETRGERSWSMIASIFSSADLAEVSSARDIIRIRL
jgi:hypothetical protein